MKDILRQELEDIGSRGLRRSMRTLASSQGRAVMLDGRQVLNFCSNDYLGLAGDQRLVQAAGEAMQRRGFGAGASRLVCGNFDEHDALEDALASMKHAESALVFSSGYMANTGIIASLAGREDAVFSDRLNHASIIDGIILSRARLHRYPHCDADALEGMLRKSTARRKLIVTDTVFSMDGDMAPLKDLVALAKKHRAWLMVDEAHAFGVFGPTGAGLVEEMGLEADVPVQMGTLSKAAGSCGAYAAGSAALKEMLVNTARSFIYTTGLPLPVAAASRAALNVMRQEPFRRAKVLENARKMRQALQAAGFDVLAGQAPIIPVIIGDADRAVEFSRKLLGRGVFVTAIRPPTVPVHGSRLRVTVTAVHTDDDINQCVEAFKYAR